MPLNNFLIDCQYFAFYSRDTLARIPTSMIKDLLEIQFRGWLLLSLTIKFFIVQAMKNWIIVKAY